MSEGTFNPAARRLCPDGSCIGLIGSDGRCRVCGRAGDGSAPAVIAMSEIGDDDGGDEDSFAADSSAAESNIDGETTSGGFRPDRRLCEDGNCVGVIGAGDVCSVCGRPAEAEPCPASR